MRSDMIKKGIDRAPHRSLLRATGVKTRDIEKPFIGVCNSYIDIIPGHMHLNVFAFLHTLAIANEAEVDYDINRINEIAEKTPYLAKVSPASDYTMDDVHQGI